MLARSPSESAGGPAHAAREHADREQPARADARERGAGEGDQRDLEREHQDPHVRDRIERAAERAHVDREDRHRALQEEVREQREAEQAHEGAVAQQPAPVALGRAQRHLAAARQRQREQASQRDQAGRDREHHLEARLGGAAGTRRETARRPGARAGSAGSRRPGAGTRSSPRRGCVPKARARSTRASAKVTDIAAGIIAVAKNASSAVASTQRREAAAQGRAPGSRSPRRGRAARAPASASPCGRRAGPRAAAPAFRPAAASRAPRPPASPRAPRSRAGRG